MKHEKDLAELRHSAAHLLAHAVIELFPKTLLTIGPSTQDGFFYDFLPERNFKEEDLPILEARMHEIAKRNLPIQHYQVSKEQAHKMFAGNRFKLELIDQIPDQTVGIAQQGDFLDLCKGGHVPSTGDIKHFKLLSISGSYWRADKKNQPLQRMYGTAFFQAEDLQKFLDLKEQAALYDHRKLGKQLDLFSFHDEGVGFAFFHPKGKKIINVLIEYIRKLLDHDGYQEISTPILLSDQLWQQSGHYAHYKNNMFFSTIDEQSYAVKPMNCPGAILVYKERPHSYRELPLRLAEFGLVHRYELSGVLHGLFRVRAFTQDDAHIFCTPDQIEQEVLGCITMVNKVLNRFNFSNIEVAVATKPANAMGSDELWARATKALESALTKAKLAYTIAPGQGAFYGPKIEFRMKDSMNREWQCGTVQVDFFQPENFDLTYVASSGAKERPVVIHRAIYGSLERFLGILLEHYKGHLPFWLAPVQIKVLTITDAQKEYAQSIVAQLKARGIRAEADTSSDPVSGQIKSAQLEKIPWMIIIGKKEMESGSFTLRYNDGKQEPGLTWTALIEKAHLAQEG